MVKPQVARLPKYRRQSSGKNGKSDQAFVEFRGRRYYLGVYDSKESKAAYHRFCAALAESPPAAVKALGGKAPEDLSIHELIKEFWAHAKKHYRKDGQPTSEQDNLKSTLRMLGEMFGDTEAQQFGPFSLKLLRQEMIVTKGWARTTINQRTGHVRRIFKWAAENELVPASVWHGLQAVSGLQRNRSEARETEPVRAVDDAIVSATLPYLPPVVADMVRFQRLTGCRPGEACKLRPRDIDFDSTANVWAYWPARHKTQHRGRDRVVFIGPKAQEVLRPYLNRRPDAYCFSPAESEAQRLAERHANRKTPIEQGNRPGLRNGKPTAMRATVPMYGECYTKDSYNRAVRRAVDRANAVRKREEKEATLFIEPVKMLPRWRPNQLRHSCATELRRRFGVEVARTVLGHSEIATSEIYAERDLGAAAAVMKEVG